jgi:hypothetical protein
MLFLIATLKEVQRKEVSRCLQRHGFSRLDDLLPPKE